MCLIKHSPVLWQDVHIHLFMQKFVFQITSFGKKRKKSKLNSSHLFSQRCCPDLLFTAEFGFQIHTGKNNCIAMIQSLWHQFPIFLPESACLLSLSINKWQVISVTHRFPTSSCLPQRHSGSKYMEHEGQDLNSVRTLWLCSKTVNCLAFYCL